MTRIREARLRAGLKLHEASRRARVSAAYLGAVERGAQEQPAALGRAAWFAGRERFRRGIALSHGLEEQRARMERLELPEIERREWLSGFCRGYLDIAKGT